LAYLKASSVSVGGVWHQCLASLSRTRRLMTSMQRRGDKTAVSPQPAGLAREGPARQVDTQSQAHSAPHAHLRIATALTTTHATTEEGRGEGLAARADLLKTREHKICRCVFQHRFQAHLAEVCSHPGPLLGVMDVNCKQYCTTKCCCPDPLSPQLKMCPSPAQHCDDTATVYICQHAGYI
jgi:hypothetical protein